MINDAIEYDISNRLKENFGVIASGELLPDSLVWKQGMATWEKANTVADLKGLFPPKIV